MNYTDRERVKRLAGVFDGNYRISNLYSTYLERFPEFISADMVDALTEDGRISKKEGVCALLEVAFALNSEKDASDRSFVRKYITPSVRILDTKRYTENPYYKNIKIGNIKDGEWELKNEYYPPYLAFICDDMDINDDFSEIPPLGFFDTGFTFPAVLEGGNEWMTLTPVDLDTSADAITRARGKVVTFGLGLGYFAYMASEKEDVTCVTVVEKSPDVIRLFKKHILPQFNNSDKIKIVNADAFLYAENVMPGEGFDFAFVDTWRDASDGVPMYEKMKKLEAKSPECEFSYWIENFLKSRIRALRFESLYKKVISDAPDAPGSYDEFLSQLTDGVK